MEILEGIRGEEKKSPPKVKGPSVPVQSARGKYTPGQQVKGIGKSKQLVGTFMISVGMEVGTSGPPTYPIHPATHPNMPNIDLLGNLDELENDGWPLRA